MSLMGLHASSRNMQRLQGLGQWLQDCYHGSADPVTGGKRRIAGACVLDLKLVTERDYLDAYLFRTQRSPLGADDPGDQAIYADPVGTARRWIDSLLPIWRQNRADAQVWGNELDPPDPAHAALFDRFTLEMMQYLDSKQEGFSLGIYAFSTGNPKAGPVGEWAVEDMWRALLPSTRYAVQHGHWLCLHNHGLTDGLIASGEHLALRHRKAVRFWQDENDRALAAGRPEDVIDFESMKIAYTETSNGVDGIEPNLTEYYDAVHWLDTELMTERPRVVKFFSLYQWGGETNMSPAYDILRQHHIDHPTPILPPAPLPHPKILIDDPREYHDFIIAYLDSHAIGWRDVEPPPPGTHEGVVIRFDQIVNLTAITNLEMDRNRVRLEHGPDTSYSLSIEPVP